MNPDNYASLEASRRLVEAGIVLLYVEKAWIHDKWKDTWELGVVTPTIEARSERWEFYSAPSMAEVWRGLPPEDVLYHYFDKYKHFFWYDWKVGQVFSDVNPTDALIDLLIFVRKQEGGRG